MKHITNYNIKSLVKYIIMVPKTAPKLSKVNKQIFTVLLPCTPHNSLASTYEVI